MLLKAVSIPIDGGASLNIFTLASKKELNKMLSIDDK